MYFSTATLPHLFTVVEVFLISDDYLSIWAYPSLKDFFLVSNSFFAETLGSITK
jgi:hypothetical protein